MNTPGKLCELFYSESCLIDMPQLQREKQKLEMKVSPFLPLANTARKLFLHYGEEIGVQFPALQPGRVPCTVTDILTHHKRKLFW